MNYVLEISGPDYVPAVAKVEVSKEEFLRWSEIAEFIKNTPDAYCVQLWDYRCEFFHDDGQEFSEFQQGSSCLVVGCDRIYWTGYEKHSGSHSRWETDVLLFKDLREDFA